MKAIPVITSIFINVSENPKDAFGIILIPDIDSPVTM
jgi:hypothetical protein